jgi:hypothetical protein
MKRVALVLLVLVALLAATSLVASAKGGSKGVHVCWRQGTTEIHAIYQVTGSGIVQQWVYAPFYRHTVFKPVSKFPSPDGDGWWGPWTGHTYDKCAEPTDYKVTDFLPVGEQFWVKFNYPQK